MASPSANSVNPNLLAAYHLGGHERSENFESNVLAEEIEKARTLTRIRSYARDRAESDNHSIGLSVSPAKSNYLNSLYQSNSNGSDNQYAVGESIEEVDDEKEDSFELADGAQSTMHQPDDVRHGLFDSIPEPYPHATDFQRVIITTDNCIDQDAIEACKKLNSCMQIREKWISDHPPAPQDQRFTRYDSQHDIAAIPGIKKRASSFERTGSGSEFRRRQPPDYDVFSRPIPPSSPLYSYTMVKGVTKILKRADEKSSAPISALTAQIDSQSSSSSTNDLTTSLPTSSLPSENASEVFTVYSFDEFVRDFNTVRQAVFGGPTISYSYKQLELLSAKFHLHELLNGGRELDAQKSVPHRDFYNVRKVDTHVHHSACMVQKHLLRFIKSKLRRVPDEVVVFRDGKFLTLGEVFKSLHLTAYDLSIDTLDMHANDTFHRFDRFNLKYNPAGQSRLREIFLKTDNVIGGRYLAEITKEVMSDLEAAKYQLVEWRVSIYGRKASEWDNLAKWFYSNRLSHMNVRWLIQIPRLFHVYRESGELRTFEQMLNNIFAPLFAVTLDPSSNPALHYFLETIVGIDSVDDESRPEHGQLSYGVNAIPTPDNWLEPLNPPYGYWMYYMYANLCALNKLRASLNLCTFQFRPHCGEAGDIDHLISTYLVSHQINHGIQLRKNASLQYLYYLSQIGIAMSPLSNNKLFLDYAKNPFPKYFYIGMNVSLSTDDPLMLHYTKDPLVEEYSVAAQVWKLNSADLCEIARNSVLQSGWEREFKEYFLGKDLRDIKETNVPDIRLRYRQETLEAEIEAIRKNASL